MMAIKKMHHNDIIITIAQKWCTALVRHLVNVIDWVIIEKMLNCIRGINIKFRTLDKF